MNASLLVKVAKLYYEEGLTQHEIANKIHVSRPKVSRLLKQARSEGVVQIIVSSFPNSNEDLERELEITAGLKDSIVIEVNNLDDPQAVSRELGAAAANYFQRVVKDGDIVGFSWGNTISEMAESIKPIKLRKLQIVQMVGGLGDPLSNAYAADITHRVAKKMDSNLVVLPAPGIVETVQMCQALQKNRQIHYALELSSKVNVAFVGIGSFRKDSLLMRNEEIITWAEVNPLIQCGAVGDLGLHFFDIDGHSLDSEIDQRVIGVDLDIYKKLDRVVAVAGGNLKYDAILGAIRGGYANVLITDESTAHRLIQDIDKVEF